MGNKTFDFVEPLKDFAKECLELYLGLSTSLYISAMCGSQAMRQVFESTIFSKVDLVGFWS